MMWFVMLCTGRHATLGHAMQVPWQGDGIRRWDRRTRDELKAITTAQGAAYFVDRLDSRTVRGRNTIIIV